MQVTVLPFNNSACFISLLIECIHTDGFMLLKVNRRLWQSQAQNSWKHATVFDSSIYKLLWHFHTSKKYLFLCFTSSEHLFLVFGKLRRRLFSHKEKGLSLIAQVLKVGAVVLGPVHTGRVSRFACKSFDVACSAVWTLLLTTVCPIICFTPVARCSASCVNGALGTRPSIPQRTLNWTVLPRKTNKCCICPETAWWPRNQGCCAKRKGTTRTTRTRRTLVAQ